MEDGSKIIRAWTAQLNSYRPFKRIVWSES